MKYVDEFRQQSLAYSLANTIAKEADTQRHYHLMEFCGGHTHAIFRYGVQGLMPDNVHFVHGPGCPVCVLPTSQIDKAIYLCETYKPVLCIYGDLLRVPASKHRSLLKAKASGADIRMVFSTMDAIKIAQHNPQREVVFFAIGFETTTPPSAVAIMQAKKLGLTNFTLFCNHVMTPAAIHGILDTPQNSTEEQVKLDGFLGPSHVSTIIGSKPYEIFANKYNKPVVIAGFEPLDVMQSVLMLIRQLNDGRSEVENEYTRAVTREGNLKAQALVNDVFDLRESFEWRGLGFLPDSALKIKDEFSEFNSEQRFEIPPMKSIEAKGCDCPAILRGLKRPIDCKLFGTVCTPDNPVGSCMVSSEGACAAYWSYGRYRQPQTGTIA